MSREKKYTPGPLEIINNSGSPSGFFLANREYSSWPVAVDMNKEDATLFRASHDLLEALEPFANYACDDWKTHDCHNCAAKRAVEKAYGGHHE